MTQWTTEYFFVGIFFAALLVLAYSVGYAVGKENAQHEAALIAEAIKEANKKLKGRGVRESEIRAMKFELIRNNLPPLGPKLPKTEGTSSSAATSSVNGIW